MNLIRTAALGVLLPLSVAAAAEQPRRVSLAAGAPVASAGQDSVKKAKTTKSASAAKKTTAKKSAKRTTRTASTASKSAAAPSKGASATAPHPSATGAEHAASHSAAATAGTGDAGSVKVNRFMSYNASTKTVSLDVIAALTNQQGGFNFNGGSNGSQTVTIPQGWSVKMHVKNVDAIPHSVIVIADQRPLPNAPDAAAIPRAYSAHVNDGLAPQNGADEVDFRASKAGDFLIYCGVPGHGPSGMFIKLVVSSSATVPAYSM